MHTQNTHTYKSQDGFFPLYCACHNGYCEIAEMLLKAGATVNLQAKVEDCFNLFIYSVPPTVCSLYSYYNQFTITSALIVVITVPATSYGSKLLNPITYVPPH